MKLKDLPSKQRVQRLKEIFSYANQEGVTQEQVAKAFWITKDEVRRILGVRKFEEEITANNLVYTCKRGNNFNNNRRVLTTQELQVALTCMHNAKTLLDAAQRNPYDPFHESDYFLWVDEMIKHLWELRGAKANMFEGKTVGAMPAPCLFLRRTD